MQNKLGLDEATFRSLLVHATRDGEVFYDEEDLRRAAAELELDEQAMRASLEAHALLRRKPSGSRIEAAAKDGELEVRLPAAGLTGSAVFGIAFLVAWFGFLIDFGGHSFGLRLFTIPHWLGGIAVAWAVLRSTLERKRIVVGATEGTFERSIGPFCQRRPLASQELRARLVEAHSSDNGRGQSQVPDHLVLESGAASYRLCEGASRAEIEWLASLLSAWTGLGRTRRDDAGAWFR